jgi:hypothetical protein
MKPRDFVIANNIRFSNCVYTVIPVIDGQLLDLPYHLQRLRHSLCAADPDPDCLDSLFFNDFIADSCLKSMASYRWNDAADGLLTICVGSKSDNGDDSYHKIEKDRCGADSYLYGMQKSYLFESRSDLRIDLQEDMRVRDLTIKSASWPIERLHMEAKRPQGVAETVMYKSEPRSIGSKDALSQVLGKPYTKTLTEGQIGPLLHTMSSDSISNREPKISIKQRT